MFRPSGKNWETKRRYLRERERERGIDERFVRAIKSSRGEEILERSNLLEYLLFLRNRLRSRGEFQSAMSFRAAARAIYALDLSPINK